MNVNEAVVGIVMAVVFIPIISVYAMRKGVDLNTWDLLHLAVSIAGIPMGVFVVIAALREASETNSNKSIIAGAAGVAIAIAAIKFLYERVIAIRGAVKIIDDAARSDGVTNVRVDITHEQKMGVPPDHQTNQSRKKRRNR